MNFNKILVSVLSVVLCTVSYAEMVKDIVIEGLHVVPMDVVEEQMLITEGSDVNQEDIQAQIKALYKMRLFKQVSISLEGSVLYVKLTEQPVIRSINIDSSLIGESDIITQLEKHGVMKGEIYREDIMESWRIGVISELKQSGFAYPEVKVETNAAGEGVVSLDISIVEGAATKLRYLAFTGDKKFSDKKLSGMISSVATGPLSFIMQDDLFSKGRLEFDRRGLIDFYKSEGYHTPSVHFTTEDVVPMQRIWKNSYKSVVFDVNAGPLFHVESIELKEVLPEDLEVLLRDKLVGKVANKHLHALAEKVLRHYFKDDELGEYYTIGLSPIIVSYNKVKLNITVNQNIPKARHVYFIGNYATMDEALRRAMLVEESKPFNKVMLAKSERALHNLGYLKSAKIKAIPVEDGVFDIEVTVNEANSMDLKGGGSWSGWGNASIEASLSDTNFLGMGSHLDFSTNLGFKSQQVNLSYSQPNATVSGHSYSGVVGFKRQSKESTRTMSYHDDTFSIAGTYAIPVSESLRFTSGLAYIRNEYFEVEKASSIVRNYFIGKNEDDYVINQYRSTVGAFYSDLDSSFMPTQGIASSLNIVGTLPISDGVTFYELSGSVRGYYPVATVFDQPVVLRGRIKGSYALDYEDNNRDIPFFARLSAGGLGSVRGYGNNSLGPKYKDDIRQRDENGELTGIVIETIDKSKGGNKLFVANAELQLPSPLPDFVIPYAFVDVGNVFDESEDFDFSELRGAYGVSASVTVPFVGKMTFSWALPFNDKEGDSFSEFSMGMGVMF